MKNKKNIYILLPAVIIIWGLLIYRVVAVAKPTTSQQLVVTTTQFKPQKLQEAESFTISLNYRDPFLDAVKRRRKVAVKRIAKKVVVKKPTIPFPSIVYKGLVSPKGKNQQVFLIAVNGEQFFFKKNNIHKEVKLIRGTNKEVVLKFQKQQQTFKISK